MKKIHFDHMSIMHTDTNMAVCTSIYFQGLLEYFAI